MQQIACQNHPNTIAITKCTKCGKPLCLECKQQIKTSTRSGYQYQQFGGDLCPTCYYNEMKRISKFNWCGVLASSIIAGGFIGITFIGFTQYDWGGFSLFIIGFAVLSLIWTLYNQFVRYPRKLHQVKEIAERLEGANFGSSDSVSNNTPSFPASSHETVMYCKYCGNSLHYGDKSCSRCGRFVD